jgi:hypothetical protein
MKTYGGWTESRKDLGVYLQVGDEVDEKMYWYFIEALPPMTLAKNEVQIGEPVRHNEKGQPLFATLQSTDGERWFYAGALPVPLTRLVNKINSLERAGQGEKGER